MSNIIAGDPAPTNPTSLGEFVGCFGSGCQRGEWTAKAAQRGWEQPATNQWMCPQCAANAADRADFIARKTTARDELDLLLTDVHPVTRGQRLDAYRAEVLAEAADFFEGVLKETLHPERDARYWSAVHDVVRGLRCRAAGGESRG